MDDEGGDWGQTGHRLDQSDLVEGGFCEKDKWMCVNRLLLLWSSQMIESTCDLKLVNI